MAWFQSLALGTSTCHGCGHKKKKKKSLSNLVSWKRLLPAFSNTLVSLGRQCGLVARQNRDPGASSFQHRREASHKATNTETLDKSLDLLGHFQSLPAKWNVLPSCSLFLSKASFQGAKAAWEFFFFLKYLLAKWTLKVTEKKWACKEFPFWCSGNKSD